MAERAGGGNRGCRQRQQRVLQIRRQRPRGVDAHECCFDPPEEQLLIRGRYGQPERCRRVGAVRIPAPEFDMCRAPEHRCVARVEPFSLAAVGQRAVGTPDPELEHGRLSAQERIGGESLHAHFGELQRSRLIVRRKARADTFGQRRRGLIVRETLRRDAASVRSWCAPFLFA
jgi:hypothetical protein